MQGVPCIGHFSSFYLAAYLNGLLAGGVVRTESEPFLNHLIFYIFVLLCFYRGKGFELFTQRVSNP